MACLDLSTSDNTPGEQRAGVVGGEVRLRIPFRHSGLPATDDHAVAQLVEDLRDAGVQVPALVGSVECDADVARCAVGRHPGEPPGVTA